MNAKNSRQNVPHPTTPDLDYAGPTHNSHSNSKSTSWVWGTPKEGGNNQPFRFLEKPSDEDIELELGRDFTRALNYEKTAVDRPYKCLTWPVYNWLKKRVEVFEISQISISRQM